MADFYGVQSGSGATGYLVVNGNVYPAASGGSKLWSIPEGKYTYGKDLALRKDQYRSMSDRKNPKNFRKFHIWGTGPDGTIWDPRLKRYRVGIEYHYDGGNPGTAGCIGYQDVRAKDDLIADKDKSTKVDYLKNMDEVQAAIEKKLGRKVDWSKIKKPKGHGASAGEVSRTKKGNKVKKGNKTVRAGKRKRQTAHVKAPLKKGGVVKKGSAGIFVGWERFRVSGVDHMTTDGSPLGTGEDTILFT